MNTQQQDIRMPITKSVVAAARKFKIPVKKLGFLDGKMLLQLGVGKNIKWTRGAVTSNTKYLSMKIAHHKDFTNRILAKAHIPVPKQFCENNLKNAEKFLKKVKFPVVVKPAIARQGKEVHCNIYSPKEAMLLFKKVSREYRKVVIEEQISGNDFRLLIINNKIVATLNRIPPFIIGNNKNTIARLIKKENNTPKRKSKKIYPIKIDLEVKRTLKLNKLTLKSILPRGKKIFLRRNANISTGGVGVDVTKITHPKNIELAKRAVKIIGLDIGGVDLVISDITKPYDKVGGKIVELNGGPDAAIHHYPILGKPRFAGEAILKMLFPNLK